MPALEDYSIFDSSRDDEDDGAETNINNLDTTIQVSPIPTTRIHKDHSFDQVIGDLQSATQTTKMSKNLKEHGRTKSIFIALKVQLDKGYTGRASTIQVIRSLDCSWTYQNGKRAIGSKWVFRNKKDKGIEAIRLFLAYASFKDFMVYQMDKKVLFFMGRLKKRCIAWSGTLVNTIIRQWFQRGEIDKPSSKAQSQDCNILMETQKPLLEDEDGEEVDAHMYRSMIGSLMYLLLQDLTSCLQSMIVDYVEQVDRKVTQEVVNFPGSRLISWQCKKQAVVANSTTKAKYVAASSCCR
ncbi:hypothetical protein Tco_0434865 [Tanacetum coccineum]